MKPTIKKIILTVVALILIMGVIIYFQHQKIVKLKDEKQATENLNAALHDSVTYYQNKNKEWVAEKLTIQTTIKNLEKINGQLSNAQRDLLIRIKEVNRRNDIITAALIDANFKIDSLLIIVDKDGSEIIVDTTNEKINFNNLASNDTSFIFDIDVNHVLPSRFDVKPSMLFKSIEIPNRQFVEFHWENNKKKGYPISFTITNTNKYIKVIGLESYAIPSLNKLHLNPTGWQKVENFFIKNGRTIFYIGLGVAGGAGGYYMITH